MNKGLVKLLSTAAAFGLSAGIAQADQVFADDLIVDGSACVGFDCVNGESFGFDTLRLKENNLRIKFDDTSSTGSFPNVDWQLTANDTASGGKNKFSVEDTTNNRTILTLEALAPSNSLYVDDGGRVAFGNANPAVGIHRTEGNTPTLRLEQNGSQGWQPQTWDLAGNETSFFIRDTTHGSTLPFRIRPGAASNALVIDNDSDVGIGTLTADAPLHVKQSDGSARVFVEETSASSSVRTMLELKNLGRPEIVLSNTDVNGEWSIGAGSNLILKQGTVGSTSGAKTKLLDIDSLGNAVFTGTVTSSGPTCSTGCDAVFDPDYALPSISDHAAQMFALGHLPNVGPTRPNEPVNMSEQYGRMLNELEHAHIYISQQEDRLTRQDAQIAALTAAVQTLQERVDAE